MHIHLIEPSQPVSDFSVSGAVVMVAGVEIDCAQRQEDISVMIEIRDNGGKVEEGGDGAFLAQIVIPAKHYESMVEEGDGGEETHVEISLPLDPNAVAVTLWPATQNTSNQE